MSLRDSLGREFSSLSGWGGEERLKFEVNAPARDVVHVQRVPVQRQGRTAHSPAHASSVGVLSWLELEAKQVRVPMFILTVADII